MEIRDSVISIALLGDVMLTRRLSSIAGEGLLHVKELLDSADLVIGNFESTCHRFEGQVTPNISAGTYMVTPPEVLNNLKWLGIDMLACANNHAFDYGEGGVIATVNHLEEAGFSPAGIGRNLREARRPRYFESSGGRVALVSATTFFKEWSRAGSQGLDMTGRPGVSALGVKRVHHVDGNTFDILKAYAREVGLISESKRVVGFGFYNKDEAGSDSSEELLLGEASFVRSDRRDVEFRLNNNDLGGIFAGIRDARRQADVVIVSLHYHEMSLAEGKQIEQRSQLKQPAKYVHGLTRSLIDVGADIVFCHGPHILLGMDIYKGKPIFYSLGNFIMQNETVERLPLDAYLRFNLETAALPGEFFDQRSDFGRRGHASDPVYWLSFIPICEFAGQKLKSIKISPLDLMHSLPRSQRGVPTVAAGQARERIITDIKTLSGFSLSDADFL